MLVDAQNRILPSVQPVVLSAIEQLSSGAALAAAMGFANASTSLHRGDESAGATDHEGTADLADIGAPTHSIVDPSLGATVVELEKDSAVDGLSAGNELNLGSGSWAELLVGRFTESQGSGTHLVGNRAAVGTELVIFGANGLQFFVDVGATLLNRVVAQDHFLSNDGRFIVLAVNDVTADTFTLHTNLDSTGALPANTVSLDSTADLVYGKSPLRNAAGYRFALGARWIGADAEGLDASHLAALATYLGI